MVLKRAPWDAAVEFGNHTYSNKVYRIAIISFILNTIGVRKFAEPLRIFEMQLFVRSYSSMEGDQANLLLQDLNPSYVILYDWAIASFNFSLDLAYGRMNFNKVRDMVWLGHAVGWSFVSLQSNETTTVFFATPFVVS